MYVHLQQQKQPLLLLQLVKVMRIHVWLNYQKQKKDSVLM